MEEEKQGNSDLRELLVSKETDFQIGVRENKELLNKEKLINSYLRELLAEDNDAIRENEEFLNKERQRSSSLEELLKKMAQEKAQKESIALENVRAYEELKRRYNELNEQYEGTTMTLGAERDKERLEKSERLENESPQKDNEKLQEEFIKVNQEIHQTQKRCESKATKVFKTEQQSMKLKEDLTTAQRNLKEKENLANAIAKELD